MSILQFLSEISPETVSRVDAVIFFIPTLIDNVIKTGYSFGQISEDIAFNRVFLVKMIVGALVLLIASLWGWRVKKKKASHWWPLVILVGFWGLASLGTPLWGQTISICLPGYLPQDENTTILQKIAPSDEDRRSTLIPHK